MRLGRLEQASAAQEEAATATAHFGDRPVAAFAVQASGLIELASGRPEEAAARFERALAEWRAVGQLGAITWCLACLGQAYLASGRRARARAALEESVARAREFGTVWDLAQALVQRAALAEIEEDAGTAAASRTEAAAIFERLGDDAAVAELKARAKAEPSGAGV